MVSFAAMNKTRTVLTIGAAGLLGAALIAQNAGPAGNNWPHHLGDQGGTRFSTLTQINISNVSSLKRAWTFKTGSGRFASSPMVVDSVMYFSAPNGVYAIDAVTGTQIMTAGNLVFIGATIDGYFRAFDARNGKELWSDRLPAPAHSTPTTDMGRDGKQYVVIGAHGGGYFGSPTSDEVIAYTVK
jgi:glucose dehydrogenase